MLRRFVSWLLITGLYALAGLFAFALAATATTGLIEVVTGSVSHTIGYAVGAAFGIAGMLTCRDAARGGM